MVLTNPIKYTVAILLSLLFIHQLFCLHHTYTQTVVYTFMPDVQFSRL